MRNKIKQILLVEGIPEFLREDQEQTAYKLQLNGKSWYLGKIGVRTAAIIKELNPAVEISRVSQKSRRYIGFIQGAPGIKCRRAGKNTTIEVSAPTDEELRGRISAVKAFMAEKGSDIIERCQWICKVDKAKAIEKIERVDTVIKNGIGAVVKLSPSGRTERLREIARVTQERWKSEHPEKPAAT